MCKEPDPVTCGYGGLWDNSCHVPPGLTCKNLELDDKGFHICKIDPRPPITKETMWKAILVLRGLGWNVGKSSPGLRLEVEVSDDET